MTCLSWLFWDPSPYYFTLPFLKLPITWYGILFAGSFWIGFYIFVFMFRRLLSLYPEFREGDIVWKEGHKSLPKDLEGCNALLHREALSKGSLIKARLDLERRYPKFFTPLKERVKEFAESLVIYILLGTVIGARLGHVFFYEDPIFYLLHPLSILKTWEGGLASHGGIAGVVIALALFYRKYKKRWPMLTFWRLADGLVAPTMFVCGMIRMGNFFNQEILGIETSVPWGVIFGHPADGSSAAVRHPAQLYEFFFYELMFVLTLVLWRRFHSRWKEGRILGLCFATSFFFRFLIEFIKPEQSVLLEQGGFFLLMGQVLSIPMIGFGLYMLFRRGNEVPAVLVSEGSKGE